MKIYSSYRDFYDSAGEIDRTFVWSRKTEEIKDKTILENFRFPLNTFKMESGIYNFYYNFAYIFFCGTIYCAMRKNGIWRYGKEANSYFERTQYDYMDRADKFFDLHGKNCRSINIFHNSPIVTYQDESIWMYERMKTLPKGIFKNNPLNLYDFQRVVGPYMARQEIERFLRNDLAFEPTIAPVSDKVKILAHGMDPVWSFRNPDPPKRKQQKR